MRAAGGLANFITDDGIFTGPLGVALACSDTHRIGIKEFCNLDNNLDKTVLFGPHDRMDEIRELLDSKPEWAHIRFDSVDIGGQPRYGIEIGGVPIGHDDYVQSVLQRKLEKSKSNFTKILSTLKDVSPQAAHAVITQHCLAAWTFLSRTVYPYLIAPFAKRMDAFISDGMLQLTQTTVPPNSIAEARLALPLRHGGNGLRKIADVVAPAFIGAVCQCVPAFGTTQAPGGQTVLGILRHLSHLFGATSFTPGNEHSRFAVLLAGTSTLANQMRSAWDELTNELPITWRQAPEHAQDLLSQPAAAMGSTNACIVAKVQRQLTRERESFRRSLLTQSVPAALANRAAFNEVSESYGTGAVLSPAGWGQVPHGNGSALARQLFVCLSTSTTSQRQKNPR
jgi:hypothetical protein